MKKIFRMALVLALAGATLTYTSCTKDYSEEINALDKDIQNLESKHDSDVAKLESEISNLKSSLSSLETAYKAADEALNKAIKANADNIAALQKTVDGIKSDMSKLEARVAANEKAIEELKADVAKRATKEELAAAEKNLNDKLVAAQEALEKKIADEKAAIEKEIADLKAELTKEIEALQADVKTLKDDLSAAQNQIASLETEVAQLKMDVAANAEAIAAAEAKIAALAEDVAANAEAIEALEESLAAANDALAAISNELRSIVFVPQLYLLGVEAVEYNGAFAWEIALVAVDKDGYKGEIEDTTAKTAVPYVIPAKFDKNEGGAVNYHTDSAKNRMPYSLEVKNFAQYNLNPSTFDVKKADWELFGYDYNYAVPYYTDNDNAAAATRWTPVFEEITKVVDGVATIQYHIDSVENAYPRNSQDRNAYYQFSVMQLVATVNADDTTRVIRSDYEAIVPTFDFIGTLAFAKESEGTTEIECGIAEDKELYDDACDAVENAPSIQILYNGGDVDLKPLIAVHVYEANTGKEAEYSIAELQAKYNDNLNIEFAEFEYYLGENNSSQSAYANVSKDGIYTPQYVKTISKDKYESIDCPEGTKEGISSVGRYPIVRVELKDGDKLIAAGWFKTVIVKEKRENSTVNIDVPGEGLVPYTCVGDSGIVVERTTWHQFSDLVLESALHMDYLEFIDTYVPDGEEVDDDVYDMVVYALGKDGKYAASDKLGSVEYRVDQSGSGINDAIVWTLYELEAGKTYEAYIHFKNQFEDVWVKLSATVAAAPKFDFSAAKIKNEWYDDVTDATAKNTVRMNVLVPTADQTDPVIGGDVTNYSRSLNHYFVGYEQPQFVLSKEYDDKWTKELYDLYTEVKDSLYTNAEYKFADKQSTFVDAADAKYTIWKLDDTTLVASAGAKANKKAYDTLAVLTADTLAYATTDLAKQLLNAYSLYVRNEDGSYDYTQVLTIPQTSILYANVDFVATYGYCKKPAGQETFHVRFVRPLDVNFEGQDVSEESAVDGFNVELAKFISGITDWNKQKVLKQTDTGLVENVIKTVNMYKYYQFDSLYVDMANAARDNWNMAKPEEKGLISKVTPEAQIALGSVDEDEVFTAAESEDGVYALDIEDFATIAEYVINYRNDRAVVDAFNIYIPVKLTYSWGVLEDTLVIRVKPTSETEGK